MAARPLRGIQPDRALAIAATVVVLVTLAFLVGWHFRPLERGEQRVAEKLAFLGLFQMHDVPRDALRTLCTVSALAAFVLLAVGSVLMPKWLQGREATATAAIVLAAIVVLAFPSVFTALNDDSDNGKRAFRDSINFLWVTILIVSIPVFLVEGLHRFMHWGYCLCAIFLVVGIVVSNHSSRGSRTVADMLAFTVLIATAAYLGRRAQAMFRELRHTFEQLQEERDRYEKQHIAAAALLDANAAELEQAKRSRVDFLRVAVHDLAQPLHAVSVWAAILESAVRSGREEEARKSLDRVVSQVRSVAGGFKAILDYAKVASGQTPPDLQAHSVQAIFDELEGRFAMQAQEKGLRLVFLGGEKHVYTDRELLTRVLSNLISNAIKHTQPRAQRSPEITVGAKRSALLVTFYVLDRGVGIPKSARQRVFEPGYQLPQHKGQGHGLGLASVDQIARLLGHPPRLASSLGRGTLVRVLADFHPEQPAAANDKRAGKPVETDALRGALVLVVDDEPEILEGTAIMLQQSGARTLPAISVAEARAQIASTDRPPTIVVTDYMLLGLETGRDVIEVARQAHPSRRIPAVIVTAQPAAARQGVEGLDDVEVVQKPLDIQQLVALLRKHHTPYRSPLDF
jgi:signal transduction histidine kinase/CheY-like chemotaxis protein